MATTIEDVIEEHRLAIGAEKVHVTLGDSATPEGLRQTLAQMRADQAEFDSYSDLEKAQAHIARLRSVLRAITRLSQRTVSEMAAETPEMQELKSRIFLLTDLVPDVDLEADVKYMRARREKGRTPDRDLDF
jgi:hypothetical protein